MRYAGTRPPELDVPLIELETPDGRIVDLYNECSLRAVVFDRMGLAFEFAEFTGSTIRLLFSEVRGLRVEQPEDWMPQEADQIDHLLIRREGPFPQVVFKAGGLVYEFDADELSLVETPRSD